MSILPSSISADGIRMSPSRCHSSTRDRPHVNGLVFFQTKGGSNVSFSRHQAYLDDVEYSPRRERNPEERRGARGLRERPSHQHSNGPARRVAGIQGRESFRIGEVNRSDRRSPGRPARIAEILGIGSVVGGFVIRAEFVIPAEWAALRVIPEPFDASLRRREPGCDRPDVGPARLLTVATSGNVESINQLRRAGRRASTSEECPRGVIALRQIAQSEGGRTTEITDSSHNCTMM